MKIKAIKTGNGEIYLNKRDIQHLLCSVALTASLENNNQTISYFALEINKILESDVDIKFF